MKVKHSQQIRTTSSSNRWLLLTSAKLWLNPLSPRSTAYVHRDAGLPAGTWVASQRRRSWTLMLPHSAAMHLQQLRRQCVSLSHPWGWLDIVQVLCVCSHSPCVFMWAKSLSCWQMLSPCRQTSTTSGSCKLPTPSSTMEPLAGSVTKISHLNWAFSLVTYPLNIDSRLIFIYCRRCGGERRRRKRRLRNALPMSMKVRI